MTDDGLERSRKSNQPADAARSTAASDDSPLALLREELLGRRVRDVLGVEFTRPFEAAFQRVLTTSKSEMVAYPLETMYGEHGSRRASSASRHRTGGRTPSRCQRTTSRSKK